MYTFSSAPKQGSNPRVCRILSVNVFFHSAPLDFNLYSSGIIITCPPFRFLHSYPAVKHSLYLVSASRYSFPISYIFIYKSFNSDMRNIILTDSLGTTLDYDMDAGTCLRWPPPTYLDFLGRSNFT